jgi:hypothetical protein
VEERAAACPHSRERRARAKQGVKLHYVTPLRAHISGCGVDGLPVGLVVVTVVVTVTVTVVVGAGERPATTAGLWGRAHEETRGKEGDTK